MFSKRLKLGIIFLSMLIPKMHSQNVMQPPSEMLMIVCLRKSQHIRKTLPYYLSTQVCHNLALLFDIVDL